MSVSRGVAAAVPVRAGVHEGKVILAWKRKRLGLRVSDRFCLKPERWSETQPVGSTRERKGRKDRTGRNDRTGPPLGGPVRSIRKNSVLPGYGPSDLHFGKNGNVQHKRSSPPTPYSVNDGPSSF